MVKFDEQYEQQKIPEWYNSYFDYNYLRKKMNEFKKLEKDQQIYKLPGVFYFSLSVLKIVQLRFHQLKDGDQKQADDETNKVNTLINSHEIEDGEDNVKLSYERTLKVDGASFRVEAKCLDFND